MTTFADLGLSAPLLRALEDVGYESPSPIQEQAIPSMLVGRVMDLMQRGSLVLHDCRFVVLDEADEMLDLGFLEDVEKILSATPNSRQTALFSATMPPPIRKLADRYLYDPVHVKVKAATLTVDTVEQFRVEVKAADKADKLVEVLAAERPEQAIVFVRTKIRGDQLYRKL